MQDFEKQNIRFAATKASDLVKEYGPDVIAEGGAVCYHHALKAFVEIVHKSKGEVIPHIWSVDFPDGENHAYLQVGETVYNNGITWPDGKYPDLLLPQLQEQGRDVTIDMIMEALNAYSKTTQDHLQFAEVLSRSPYGKRYVIEMLAYSLLRLDGMGQDEAMEEIIGSSR